MKRALLPSLAVACLASLATPALADPAGSADDAPGDPPLRPDDPRSHLQMRIAALGEYRGFTDLSYLGAGVQLSAGDDRDKSGQVNLRFTTGSTPGGLKVLDASLGGSAEIVVAGGLLLGVGGGLALFGVQRATDGSDIVSIGPELYGRLGYRFGRRNAPFVTLDFGSELQTNGTLVWGPTAAVGWRF